MIGRLTALVSPSYRFRSSVTGHFVSKWYALTHPRTTEREAIKRDEGDAL
jgi:hypothetical protein